MMRVVQVMASGERGGGADHLVGLLPELRSAGIECPVVTGSTGPLADRLEALGFSVRRLDMMRSRIDPRTWRQLRAAIRPLEADVVHCHGTRAAFVVALARPGPPWVYSVHGLSYRGDGAAIGRALRLGAEGIACRLADEVVSVSAADLVDLRKRRALAGVRGIHIPNAVDMTRFDSPDRTEGRRRIGIADDAFVVGTVARLVTQKAVHDLVTAASRVPGVTLIIVGDGPQRPDLEELARTLGISARFLGSRDDVEAILPSFDVFVLPSRWEGEPIALLEAMATRLPCIATATSGSREVIASPAIGMLVPIGDPDAMARAIATLRADPDRRAALGSAAKHAVEQRSWRSAALRLAEVYREVIARHA